MHLKMMMKWSSSLSCKFTSLYIDHTSRFSSKLHACLHKVFVKQSVFKCLCLTDRLTHLEQLCVVMYAVYHHSEICILVVSLKTMSTHTINTERSQKVYTFQTRMKWCNTMCRADGFCCSHCVSSHVFAKFFSLSTQCSPIIPFTVCNIILKY